MGDKAKLPESRASRLDTAISERTRRIFSGSPDKNDFNDLHRLVVEKAESLAPRKSKFNKQQLELLRTRRKRRLLRLMEAMKATSEKVKA